MIIGGVPHVHTSECTASVCVQWFAEHGDGSLKLAESFDAAVEELETGSVEPACVARYGPVQWYSRSLQEEFHWHGGDWGHASPDNPLTCRERPERTR